MVDLEATCSDDGSISADDMEIIEIGACWATENGVLLERFHHLVKPLNRPTLTPFCMKLIGITQDEVDQAPPFPVAARALADFAEKCPSDQTVWMSWGNYDFKQLVKESERHGVAMPLAMPHKSAKRLFAKAQRIGKEVGMAKACALAGLDLEGQHHRGLDDAMNIARLMPWILGSQNLRGPAPAELVAR